MGKHVWEREHVCLCVSTSACVRAGLCALHVLAVLASRDVLAGPGTAPCEGLLRPPSPLSLPWLDWLQGSPTCGSRPSLASPVPCARPGLCPVKTRGPGWALPRGPKGPCLPRQAGPLSRSHLQPGSRQPPQQSPAVPGTSTWRKDLILCHIYHIICLLHIIWTNSFISD